MRTRGAMTFRQIGEREGVTPSAAWQIYRRALRKLRREHREREFVQLLLLRWEATGEDPARLAAG
jgi:DNA-directed RNA polymerase sigma subunit (sigma70/sigma32)